MRYHFENDREEAIEIMNNLNGLSEDDKDYEFELWLELNYCVDDLTEADIDEIRADYFSMYEECEI